MTNKNLAFTLLEMVIVVMIIGILSSVLIPVLTNQVLKARIARTRSDIRTLETAISRFKIDTGEYPPSGSEISDPIATGNGYLSRFLRHEPQELPGDAAQDIIIPSFINRISEYWDGPYIEIPRDQIDFNGYPSITRGIAISLDQTARTNGRGTPEQSNPNNQQILDAFGEPFRYIHSGDYVEYGGTERSSADPFYETETYYNARTFQIVSGGPNLISFPNPQIGLDADDITNF